MAFCSALHCASSSKKKVPGISFHGFPLNEPERCQRWVIATRRESKNQNFPTPYSVLCSKHFEESCFKPTSKRRTLHCNAVPSNFWFPSTTDESDQPRGKPSARKRLFRGDLQKAKEPPLPKRTKAQKSDETPKNIISSEHNYCSSSSPTKIAKKFKRKIHSYQRLLNRKRQTINYQKKKIVKYKQILYGINKRTCVEGRTVIANSFEEVLRELVRDKSDGKARPLEYSQAVRTFALTLHFYSAKAYSFLRKHLYLPCPRTLRSWAASVDGKPGFTEASFARLEQLVEEKGKPLKVCLLYDEVALKKGTIWDGKEVVGYTDLGHGDLGSYKNEIAKEALVFMVTSVEETEKHWKLPVGYCLVNGVSAELKANLIRQYIKKLYDSKLIVIAVTCDGPSANKKAFELLGADVKNKELEDGDSFFPHPSEPSIKVFCFLDACHMLKLVRNLFGSEGELVREVEGKRTFIKWEYLEHLVVLQTTDTVHAANQLRNSHLQYEKQVMKVSLAAQTLSRSVAKALLFCKDLKYEQFQGCEETATFLSLVGTAFDILNSCSAHHPGFKAPLSLKNKREVQEKVAEIIAYFKSLKLKDGTPVISCAKNTGIIGFILSLRSALGLAETLVWGPKPSLKYLLTRRMSQDHLELYFSTIRSLGGHRNNPTVLEFRAAYRKSLTAQVDEALHTASNCKSDGETAMLLVENPEGKLPEKSKDDGQTIKLNPSFKAMEHDHNYLNTSLPSLSPFSEGIAEYMAGYVAHAVMPKMKKCRECLTILLKPGPEEKKGLIALRDINDRLKNPSQDLTEIANIAERTFRDYQRNNFKEFKRPKDDHFPLII